MLMAERTATEEEDKKRKRKNLRDTERGETVEGHCAICSRFHSEAAKIASSALVPGERGRERRAEEEREAAKSEKSVAVVIPYNPNGPAGCLAVPCCRAASASLPRSRFSQKK